MTNDALLIIKKRIEKDPNLKEVYLKEKMNEQKYQVLDVKLSITTVDKHPVIIDNHSQCNLIIYEKPVKPKRSYKFVAYLHKDSYLCVDPYALPNLNKLVFSFEELNEPT